MRILLCPGCGIKLEKNLKDGEGVWRCARCKEHWFIIRIGKQKEGKGK